MEATESSQRAGDPVLDFLLGPRFGGKPSVNSYSQAGPRNRELCALMLETKLTPSEFHSMECPSPPFTHRGPEASTGRPQRFQAKSLGPMAGVNQSFTYLCPQAACHVGGRQALGTEYWDQGLVGAERTEVSRAQGQGIPALTSWDDKWLKVQREWGADECQGDICVQWRVVSPGVCGETS